MQAVEEPSYEPDFDKPDAEGDCPQCGTADEGLYWATCCGMYFCWDCFYRKHDKYLTP